jgi:hypothetical protein
LLDHTLVANQPATQYSNGGYFEDFCQASIPIRLGSLKRVLPNQTATDAGEMIAEIVRVTFEEMFHPKIKTFLEETSLDPLASDKRRRVDYRGSSAIFFGNHPIENMVWLRDDALSNTTSLEEKVLGLYERSCICFTLPLFKRRKVNHGLGNV